MLTILFYNAFFLFFLIINLNVLITAVIHQIFNPIAKFAIPVGIPTNEAKVEIETNLVTTETKISNVPCNLKPYKRFSASYSLSFIFSMK